MQSECFESNLVVLCFMTQNLVTCFALLCFESEVYASIHFLLASKKYMIKKRK